MSSMRQACCHPEVSRDRGRQAHAAKLMLTMDQLLEHLTHKVKVESENAYRCIVAAHLAQAACYIMKSEVRLPIISIVTT